MLKTYLAKQERAIRLLNRAVKLGDIKKPSKCPICGSDEGIEGHHEDYSKPYNVMWLCRKCHDQWECDTAFRLKIRSEIAEKFALQSEEDAKISWEKHLQRVKMKRSFYRNAKQRKANN